MNTTFERLSSVWKLLVETDLVKTRVVTEDNLREFSRVLGKASPVTDIERAAGNIFRFMYARDKVHFYDYIGLSGSVPLILLTDGSLVIDELGLRGIVSIHWNKQGDEYNVAVFAAGDPDVPNRNISRDFVKPRYPAWRERTDVRTDTRGDADVDSQMPSQQRRTNNKYTPRDKDTPYEPPTHRNRGGSRGGKHGDNRKEYVPLFERNDRPERGRGRGRNDNRDRSERREQRDDPKHISPLSTEDSLTILNDIAKKSYSEMVKKEVPEKTSAASASQPPQPSSVEPAKQESKSWADDE